jgi:hypothetical protein
LTIRAEGTSITGTRGILSNYMTILNDLIGHVRTARDDIDVRIAHEEAHLEEGEEVDPSLRYLKVCTVNCWTKLDEYFAKINETPATYASCVTNPLMKWKYFEHTWKDAASWKEVKNPSTWLPEGKKALESVWEEYKTLQVDDDIPNAGSKCPRSPDAHETSFNMARLYGDETSGDELEMWISSPPFELQGGETLGQYWMRLRKQKGSGNWTIPHEIDCAGSWE